MEMVVNNEKIISFWKWFDKNNEQLFPETISEKMIESLDSKVLDLGDFSWEIRQGISKPNMLIISPGGDIDLLNSTKQIINAANNLSTWEFEYFKPVKEWDYTFTIDNKNYFNSSSWEYILLKFSDDTFDILIKTNNIDSLDEDEKSIAIDIVLESILGEKLYLERITNYELVDDFKEKHKGKQNNITALLNHINHSLSNFSN